MNEPTQDMKIAANALLATVHGVMSGNEIAACEWALSEQFDDDMELMDADEPDEPFEPEKPEREDFDSDEDYENAMNQYDNEMDDYRAEYDDWERECDSIQTAQLTISRLLNPLKSLQIQFSREIANHIDTNQ